MPAEFDPISPVEAYKAIIDQLVDETSHGVTERLVRDQGIHSKAPAHDPANELVRSLSAGQREVLARMLHDERTAAIHDVLAVLTWWLGCREVGLTFRGEPMPVDLSDMGLHGDYVGRRDGWAWPEVAEPPALKPDGSPSEYGVAKAARERKRQERTDSIAARDAAITDRRCPFCGQPCPSYRKTCKHCRKAIPRTA